MHSADERFLEAVASLGVVSEEALERVRAEMVEGARGRGWAAQALLKRSELTPKQIADLRHALAETQELQPDEAVGARTVGVAPKVSAAELSADELSAAVTRDRPPRDRIRGRVATLGEVLDERFRLDALIGSGAQGLVYRARDLSLARDVAVKVLRTDAPGQAQERFLREAKEVARLGHPGIVTIFEAGTTQGGALYYAMELVQGRSLDDVLATEGPLEVERIVRIVEAVGFAIHHAHEHGLVHRDLKPANLLLDHDEGVVRVADFGLVTLAEGTRLTMTRGVVGTPVYMAPEQAEGERVDRRADVYSLGAILYEGLVGRPPFEGSTPLEIFRRIVSQQPVSLRVLDPNVPLLVERVCLRALEKDPRTRYPTAAAFSRDLHRALIGTQLAPERASLYVRRRVGRLLRSRPIGSGVAAGLLLGVVLALALRPAPEPVLVVAPTRFEYPPEILKARAAQRERLLTLARAERKLGYEQLAVDWTRVIKPDALRWDPGAARDLARARALECIAWLHMRRPGDAQRALGAAILFDGDAPAVWLARSTFLARRGEIERAAELLEKVRGQDWAVEALLERAWQADAQGESSECLAALDRAVDLTRDAPWPVVLRARLRARLKAGKVQGALWDAETLEAQLGRRVASGFEVERTLAGWSRDPDGTRLRLEGMVASIHTNLRINARQALRRLDRKTAREAPNRSF